MSLLIIIIIIIIILLLLLLLLLNSRTNPLTIGNKYLRAALAKQLNPVSQAESPILTSSVGLLESKYALSIMAIIVSYGLTLSFVT